jgi:ABC-type lipoprotein release transport system permease subunit
MDWRDATLARPPMWLFGITGMGLMLLAAALPARAASIDPMQALRSE